MQLIETIRIENGQFENLKYHQQRMNASRKTLFGCEDEIDLEKILLAFAPERQSAELLKTRIIYSEQIQKIELSPYHFPNIRSLKIVHDDQIKYNYKFLDRTRLDKLFALRENGDDILIVKNGFVTDSWFANVVFFDGNQWITPENPLLKGTQRQNLLDGKMIISAPVRESEIKKFEKVRLINAMIRFEDELDIPVRNIYH